jgi:hypothetical protein
MKFKMTSYLIIGQLFILAVLFHNALAGQMKTASDSKTGPLINETAADSSEIQIEKLRIIRERLGPVAAFVDRNGLITGFRNIMIGGNTQEELINNIYVFFEQNRDLFGLSNPRLELPLSLIHFSPNGHGVIDSKQIANGLNIIYSGFHAEMGADNRFIFSMECNIYPNAQSLNTAPSIDSLEAFRIALNDTINGGYEAYARRAELKIGYFNNALHLVWDFFVGKASGSKEYFVDAHNGEIVRISRADF